MTIPVVPTSIDAAPDVPDSTAAEPTFDSQFEAFLSYLKNTFVSALNALASVTYTNAVSANENATAASADAATASAAATAAVSAAGATQWVSGTSYTAGQCVWSPIDSQTYRRKTNGAGTTDPSLDTINWQVLGTPLATLQATALLF